MALRLPLQNEMWAVLFGAALGALAFISPLIPVGLIVGAGFALLALRKPMILCYVLILAVTFASGIPRGQLVPLFVPNEPVLIGSAGLAFFFIMVRQGAPLIARPVLLAMIVYVLGTALVPLVAYRLRGYPLPINVIFSLIAPIQYIIVAVLFFYIPQHDRERMRLLQFMILCGSGVAIIGLLQAFGFGPIVTLLTSYYSSDQFLNAADVGRVTSVFGSWNTLGNYLMTVIIFIMALHGHVKRRLYLANMLISLGLCGACLLASGSFASLGGMVAGIFLIKVFDRANLKILIAVMLAMAIGFIALQGLVSERLEYQFGGNNDSIIPQTLAYRFEVWTKIYLPIISRNLWWGWAPTFESVSWGWAESQYFFLLFRSGLVSLIAHLVYVGLLIGWAWSNIKTPDGLKRRMSIGLFVMLSLLSVMGFTNEVFTSSGTVEYLWLAIGMFAAEVTKTVTVAPVWQRARARIYQGGS
jgi:hypothetical protein